jgi:hypothetical protein
MRLKRQLVLLSALVAVGAAAGQSLAAAEAAKLQTIYRTGSPASVKGSAEYFTGVRLGSPIKRPCLKTQGVHLTC